MKLSKENFIQLKIYFDRARMYIGYLQFFMVGIVFFQSIQNTMLGDFVHSFSYVFIVVLLFLFTILILFLGYLDTRFGLRQEELKNLSNSNPIMMEILTTLRELKEEKDQKQNDENERIKSVTPYQFVKFQENGFADYFAKIKNFNGVFCVDFEDSVKSDNELKTTSLKNSNRNSFINLTTKECNTLDYNHLGFRINSKDSDLYVDDLKTLISFKTEFNCLFIPKMSNVEQMDVYFNQLEDVKCHEIIPIIETKEGFENLESIVRFKNKRFNKIAFGHCDYNMSMGYFPFIHQRNSKYWDWINRFAVVLSSTKISFINSPFLDLNDERVFQGILTRLTDSFNTVGQITLCIKQTEICSISSNVIDDSSDFTDLNSKSASMIAKEIIERYESNRIENKSFAMLKHNRVLISPHEYSTARIFADEI